MQDLIDRLYRDYNYLKQMSDKYNQTIGNNPAFHFHTELAPGFFTGDITKQGMFATLSLNPAYSESDAKRLRPECKDSKEFANHFNACLSGFSAYNDAPGQKVHRTFLSLLKVACNPNELLNPDKATLLQDRVINIDWCPLYSQKFPTIRRTDFEKHELGEMYDRFNETTTVLINRAKPRLLFIHGKSLEPLYQELVGGTDEVAIPDLKHGNQTYELRKGALKGSDCPVFYQSRHVVWANSNESLERVRKAISGVS